MRLHSPLPRFLALYGGLFAAFGVASPFLPALLQQDGLGANRLGVVLAGGTAIRLLAGPAGGRLADRLPRPSLVLAGFAAVSALLAMGYAPARGFLPLLLVSVAHAAVLAPLTPVADALALGSAGGRAGFAYGWVRGAGSAAFIAGALAAGQLVGRLGLGVIIWLNAGLLAAAAALALLVPDRLAGIASTPDQAAPDRDAAGGMRALLGIPVFVRLMVVAALVGGSHALHDSFEVIRWRAAGLSPAQCSELWALAVAAEVAVFLLAGRWLLDRIGPARAMTLAAGAGMVRWSAAALTASFPVMALVEPLHGLSFALLHLACMDVIAASVPRILAATAQAFYGTIAMGAFAAVVTLAAGPLYGHFGAGGFWCMAAMCAAALPLAATLRVKPG